MRNKLNFLHVDIQFHVPKCVFIFKNSSLKLLVTCSPIFAADTKINFDWNFEAPLTKTRRKYL